MGFKSIKYVPESEVDTFERGENPELFFDVQFEGSLYIFEFEDRINAGVTSNLPSKMYRFVRYYPERDVSVVTEVKDKGLIQRVYFALRNEETSEDSR